MEYDDGWRLFDLVADPREEHDVAKKHAETVSDMRKRYKAWEDALPPVIPLGDGEGEGGGRMPHGYGWATDAAKEKWPPTRSEKKASK